MRFFAVAPFAFRLTPEAVAEAVQTLTVEQVSPQEEAS